MLTKEDIINIRQNIDCIELQLKNIKKKLRNELKDSVISDLLIIENMVSSLIIEIDRSNKESIQIKSKGCK